MFLWLLVIIVVMNIITVIVIITMIVITTIIVTVVTIESSLIIIVIILSSSTLSWSSHEQLLAVLRLFIFDMAQASVWPVIIVTLECIEMLSLPLVWLRVMQVSYLSSSSTAKKVADSTQDKAHNPASSELGSIMPWDISAGLVAHMENKTNAVGTDTTAVGTD